MLRPFTQYYGPGSDAVLVYLDAKKYYTQIN